jgi:hypothetical protein
MPAQLPVRRTPRCLGHFDHFGASSFRKSSTPTSSDSDAAPGARSAQDLGRQAHLPQLLQYSSCRELWFEVQSWLTKPNGLRVSRCAGRSIFRDTVSAGIFSSSGWLLKCPGAERSCTDRLEFEGPGYLNTGNRGPSSCSLAGAG